MATHQPTVDHREGNQTFPSAWNSMMGKQPLQRLFQKGPLGGTIVQQLHSQLLNTPKPEDAAQGSGCFSLKVTGMTSLDNEAVSMARHSSCCPHVQSCSANKELSQLLSNPSV